MAHDQRTKYLFRRGNVWQVRLAIPRDLWPLYSTTHKQETLGTGDLDAAHRAKFGVIDGWHREFERKRRQSSGVLAPDIQEAFAFRSGLRDAANDEDAAEIIQGLAADRAEEIEQTAGYPAAKRWYELATEYTRPTVQEAFSEWLDNSKRATATKMQYRYAFREMLAHLKLGGDAMPEHVTREHAKEFVRYLDTEAKGQRGLLAYGTKLGRVMALSSFWTDHLIRNELAEANPWKPQADRA